MLTKALESLARLAEVAAAAVTADGKDARGARQAPVMDEEVGVLKRILPASLLKLHNGEWAQWCRRHAAS